MHGRQSTVFTEKRNKNYTVEVESQNLEAHTAHSCKVHFKECPH